MLAIVLAILLGVWVGGELISGRLMDRTSHPITRANSPKIYWVSVIAHACILALYLTLLIVDVLFWQKK
ncbi:MAG TPA: hypothetical protein VN541_16455 [Tepidisphaeraceae bacterium]|nr:hypothetical protein [Tepidisphaeraceae bacterium]